VAWALLLNALSFVAVMVALRARRQEAPPPAPLVPTPLWRGVREGLQAVRTDVTLGAGVLLMGAVALLVAPFIGLLPAYSLQVLGGTDADTGLLMSAQGLGSVGAALLVGSLAARLGPGRTLALGTLTLAPIAALFWLAPSVGSAALALVPLGALYFLLVNGVHALCQGRVPRALQGRVSSLLSASLSAGYTAGVALQGWLGDRVGLRPTAVGAAFLFAALVLSAGRRTLRPLFQPAPVA
jgi:predicted MFS family arabinose efflux permease